jgi:hypothetical protein
MPCAPVERARRASLSELSDVVEEVKRTTLAHRRTANKDRVRTLRERLTPKEQSILMSALRAPTWIRRYAEVRHSRTRCASSGHRSSYILLIISII